MSAAPIISASRSSRSACREPVRGSAATCVTDQPPVRRERGELGRVRRVRAKDRQDVRHPGGGMLAEFRDAADGDARRCATGAHWLALALASRQNFSRIKAESEY